MIGGGYLGSTYFGGDPVVASGSPVTASSAVTQSAHVVAAQAVETFAASSAVTQSAHTVAATASQTFVASSSVAHAPHAIAAAGSERFIASSTVAQSAHQVAAAASLSFSARSSVAQAPHVVHATDSEGFVASSAVVQSPHVISATAHVPTTVDGEAYDTSYSSGYAEPVDSSTGAAPAGGTKPRPARRRHIIIQDDEPQFQPSVIHYASASDLATSTERADGEVVRPPKKFVRINRSPKVVDGGAWSGGKSGGGCHGSLIAMSGAKSESLSSAVAEAFIYWRVTDPWSVSSQKADGAVIRNAECRTMSKATERCRGKVVGGFSAEELEMITAAATYLLE